MRRRITTVFCCLLFLVGFGVLAYPTVSNQWNTYRQSNLIADYEEKISTIPIESFEEEWEAARRYNESFEFNNIYSDVFGAGDTDVTTTEYWNVLNITEDGTMGYLEIPKIKVKLSINHGTTEDVLQTSIGHLSGSKLPIGGEGNHTVLAAHRGLPSAKLFTDIDQLENGDVFYLHIMDKVMAYQVDQILPMVDKNDNATLEQALQVVENEDYVTLFTCTPYGVNTHRLLVRGQRIPYVEDVEPTAVESMVETIQNYYMLYAILGLSITSLVIIGINSILRSRRKRRREACEEA